MFGLIQFNLTNNYICVFTPRQCDAYRIEPHISVQFIKFSKNLFEKRRFRLLVQIKSGNHVGRTTKEQEEEEKRRKWTKNLFSRLFAQETMKFWLAQNDQIIIQRFSDQNNCVCSKTNKKKERERKKETKELISLNRNNYIILVPDSRRYECVYPLLNINFTKNPCLSSISDGIFEFIQEIS